jgi:hypothetical protein
MTLDAWSIDNSRARRNTRMPRACPSQPAESVLSGSGATATPGRDELKNASQPCQMGGPRKAGHLTFPDNDAS